MITKEIQKKGVKVMQDSIKEHTEKHKYIISHYRRLALSYKDIALRLNVLGYRTRRGQKHNTQSIMRIFHRI